MKKKIILLSTIIILSIAIRLFVGVYTHDEFGDEELFLKYKPTWKWHFHSPIGMSDRKFEDLSEEDKNEQNYFNEYVSRKGLSR